MAPIIQHPAPDFNNVVSVEAGEFKEVSLKDYRGRWYDLGCFFLVQGRRNCPTEIIAFDKALPEFAQIHTAVVGVSTDSEYSHLKWAELNRREGGLGPNLQLPLIADRNMKLSRDYGVLIEEKGIALRGLFIIDPQGILRQITINDLPVGRSVEETLRLVKAFQFTDKHGEVCPSGWQEGGLSIKADPKDSLEYFSAVEKKRDADSMIIEPSSHTQKRTKA
ncbi:2-cysteine peroxiredoxin [Cantharellus anzutake]|uniref:2-cysteine peroxiredoxin n=1 Tax=Cantharellus anzutake TaxID=1750568 RepID=UPI001907A324|nr:2-cysteine peroxiredoxin [Cantharellus anzutake]KAF8332333.1 2-cysteine peroxiredoxin [Cantharellus anzutake]